MPNPSDFFGTVNSPIATWKLSFVWIGMGLFIGAIISLFRDWSHAHRVGLVTYGLFVILVLLLIFIFLPESAQARV